MKILPKGLDLGGGVLVGAAVVLLAPMVIPMIGGILKPVAKAAIKTGILMYEKGKVMTAEAQEAIEDMAAEARAEISQGSPGEDA